MTSFTLNKRLCPSCGSRDVSRSHQHGLLERRILPVFRVRPYRCVECDNRFYARTRLQKNSVRQVVVACAFVYRHKSEGV